MAEKEEAQKITGTTGGANPQSGSADAARGLGGHSKDAAHEKGAPAEKAEGKEAGRTA